MVSLLQNGSGLPLFGTRFIVFPGSRLELSPQRGHGRLGLGQRLSLRSIRRIVKQAYRLAGVRGEGKTSHSLRHTAITSAIRHGAPLPKVQSMARHANLNTTMIYYHEVDRVEDPAEGYVDYE